MAIPFEDCHIRQLPRLTAGPFRYVTHAYTYLERALQITTLPIKQAVIARSALSLIYAQDGVDGYPRQQLLDDLVNGAEADVRGCLERGAYGRPPASKMDEVFQVGMRLALALGTRRA